MDLKPRMYASIDSPLAKILRSLGLNKWNIHTKNLGIGSICGTYNMPIDNGIL
jgi:hypothetical protein